MTLSRFLCGPLARQPLHPSHLVIIPWHESPSCQFPRFRFHLDRIATWRLEHSGDKDGEECEEEEEGEGGSLSPTQDPSCPYPRPYPRHPHHPHHPHQFPPPHHFPRRGAHHHAGGGYYYRNNFDKRFDRRGGFENIRNLENRGPYKPFYDRHYQYDNNKYCGRPPYCGERGGYKFGYSERGRRPFRPFGRPGFFHKGFPGHQFPDGRRNTGVEEYFNQEEEEEEWDDVTVSEEQQQSGCDGDEKPSQPVHTVMINNEEYTKIQTPRQEVIFKKSSLDRRQDSLDQSSVTGSTTSASGSSSTTGAADGTPGGTADQVRASGLLY
ncbi:hypothetical protein E2C01_035876 [Portunus trituberculatus]|uniref:Uncharacterized protein n=1 Tax=Portunus trituberculatus TaxID=210409 RepID=A0A5B7F9M7_PORTR|nr:hypothetical protein [Portunus trituberculatus]